MSLKDKEYLLKLIKKLHEGKASDEEVKFLSNFFVNQKNSKEWPIDIEFKEIVKEDVFSKVQEQIKKNRIEDNKVIPLYKRNIFKYAAAALIVALVSIYGLTNKPKPQVEEVQIVKTKIEVGTDKATLTLEDGSNIVLEKGQNYSAKNLTSTGDKLIYKNKKAPKPEIAYNYLTIPRGGQFFLQLSDGTKVWLNSESQLKYPVSFLEGEKRMVELIYGEAYFEVSPSTKNNGTKFIVKNRIQELEVLGTKFNIKAYQDEAIIYTTLVEGKVNVKNDLTNVLLQPNEQSRISAVNEDIEVSQVDVYNATSWVNGVFSFEGTSLKEIMKVLSRWYDLDAVFLDKEVEEIKFIGVLSKNQNIEDILNTIKDLGFINSYKINDKKIILR